MVSLREIIESTRERWESALDYLYSPRILKRDAEAALRIFYSPKKDEAKLAEKISKLAKSEGEISGLLVDMTKVAMRLHLFYSKKESSKAEELSLSMAETLRNALERVSRGELSLTAKEKSRVEKLATYWDAVASMARSLQSTKQESALREKVESNIREGRFDEAIKDLQVMLEAERKTRDTAGMVSTLRNIAEVMKKRGDLGGALDYSRRAANIDPLAWFDVGFILGEMGRYKESIKAYEKFLEKAPESASAWNNIGWGYENLPNFSKALKSYEKALTFDKRFVSSWIGKGNILRKLGKAKQAIRAYEKILEIEPSNQLALISLTGVYNDGLHEYEKAVDYAKRAFSVNPNNISARSNLAESLVLARRYKEARNHAKKVLQLDDDPSRKLAMYFTISSSYFLEGKVKEGAEYLKARMDYRASLPRTFTEGWAYDGISNLIDGSSIRKDYKKKLLEAIIGRST